MIFYWVVHNSELHLNGFILHIFFYDLRDPSLLIWLKGYIHFLCVSYSIVWKGNHLVMFDCLWTPWSIRSMEFSRSEYWSGWPSPFSKGSSQPGYGTQVSCIAGGFFTSWVTKETLPFYEYIYIYIFIYLFILLLMDVWVSKWSGSVMSNSLRPCGL